MSVYNKQAISLLTPSSFRNLVDSSIDTIQLKN